MKGDAIMSVKTKAALLKGPYDIGLVDRELVCEEDEVIVKNHLVGICGSDKSFYRGQLPPKTAEFRQAPTFPFYLGHESGGTVVEVGSKIRDFKVGDKVICFGWNNNYATYFVAKDFQLQPAPDGLEMDFVALGEPISCAMYSGLNSGVQLGDVVVVMGGGFAGLIIAQCAKLKGAFKVVVADVLDGKLKLARELGADVTVNLKRESLIEVVSDLTKGQGADVVVEAAGSESSFNTASEIIRHNGKFVFYSWVTQPITLNISRWHDDGLEFVNTCLVHHSWRERYVWTPATFRPVIQGQVKIRPLITNEFRLEDIKAGFEMADKDDTAIKIIFRI
jgi:L-iditol 2-dehydrogenase